MKRLTLLFSAVALLCAGNAYSQQLQTGFFLDDFVYSYQLNPASIPDNTNGFMGFGIDNINVGVNANIGLNSFLFPTTIDGKKSLVTGFNSAITANQFLNGLKDPMRADVDLTENLLSFGFASKKSFWTFELNLRAEMNLGLPKDLVSLLKIGATEPDVYTIKDVNMDFTSFGELAVGYSRKINDALNVGGRIKLLVGVADMSLNVAKLQATVRDDITVEGKGTTEFYVLNEQIPVDEDGVLCPEDIDLENIGPGGFGAALDLGVEYKLPQVEGLTLSASINDLGGIMWRNGSSGYAEYAGSLDGEDSELEGLEDIFQLDQEGISKFGGLGPKFNAGARYQVARMLSVGALASVRTGRFGWSEARLGATFTPGKAFSLAASAGVNSYGTCLGCAMSLKFPVINLFLGTDSIMTKFTPEYVPIEKLHTRVNLGLAIAF